MIIKEVILDILETPPPAVALQLPAVETTPPSATVVLGKARRRPKAGISTKTAQIV